MAHSRPAIGLALLCMTGAVCAADSPGSMASAQNGSGQPATKPATQPATVDGFGQPVSTSALQRYSGSGLVQNNQTITGTVTGDTASNVTTGSNAITGNAFQGATGMPSVVQNTGNNVLIQTGVIVNVQLKP
ncbi:hypothetical protein [Dyella acidisoli]|nr:hypothetical protein [Dyella acidisoli]